ncbi:MAG: hypothetical protein JF612_11650, partial [Planctomycetia bacterium]|nr:hypothetical protein [Planctomycetia bacterium]
NALLAMALNGGYEWFALLHADIAPEPYWIDKLIEEATRVEADMLSAVVPIKNLSGATSTAIPLTVAKQGTRQFIRLMMAQIYHPDFPATFDIHAAADALQRLPESLSVADIPRLGLWCNTGCFICRLHPHWDWSKICFRMDDGLERIDNQWREFNFPEDWHFSQAVADAGGKVMATRLITLTHRGTLDFPSGAWGQPRDTGQRFGRLVVG